MNRRQLKQHEDDLWFAADNLRANSDLKASEYGAPVLGLIFLKFADINYRRHEDAIQAEYEKLKGARREKPLHEVAVARCGFYLFDHARYSYQLNLPEEMDIAKAIEEAMESIELYKPELEGSLPKEEYHRVVRTDETRDLRCASSTTSPTMRPAMSSARSTNTFSATRQISELLDVSLIADDAGFAQARESSSVIRIVRKGRIWDLSKIDFDKLKEEFKATAYKNIEIADLRAFLEKKLNEMLNSNSTRRDFAERLQEIIDNYNAGSTSADDDFAELVKFARELEEEQQRRMGRCNALSLIAPYRYKLNTGLLRIYHGYGNIIDGTDFLKTTTIL
jgi:hypothetical protein